MPLERAELAIRAGSEDAFADAMRERGIPLLIRTPGVVSVRFGQGIERPETYLLLVEWAAIDDHHRFSKSRSNVELRAIISPFSIDGRMEHFDMDEG